MGQHKSISAFHAKIGQILIRQLLTDCKLTSSGLKGFTLIEVIVAIMVSLIFISVTMQMFVSAAFFRARADQYNQAFNWIQEDFETVFNKASQYEGEAQPYSSMCLATSSANGLAANFLNDPVKGAGGNFATIGPKDISGKSYVLTRTGSYSDSEDPYKLLRLTYAVTPSEGGDAIANINTEVSIYSGFKCP